MSVGAAGAGVCSGIGEGVTVDAAGAGALVGDGVDVGNTLAVGGSPGVGVEGEGAALGVATAAAAIGEARAYKRRPQPSGFPLSRE